MLAWILETLGWAAIKSLFGRFFGKKDPMQEVLKHEATIAEKQAQIVADHTQPSASDRLHSGEF